MIGMWVLMSFAYCALATALIVMIQRRRSRETDLLKQAEDFAKRIFSPLEKIQGLSEIAKIKQLEASWFEKSLSTIGVVAFFSMLIATGVQTLKSSQESIRSEELQSEVKDLENKRVEVEGELADMAGAVLFHFQQSSHLDDSERRIVVLRIKDILRNQNITSDIAVEGFELAMIIEDYDDGIKFIRRNQSTLDKSKPVNLVALAEFAYTTGDPDTARAFMKQAESALSTLPADAHERAIVLDSILYPQQDVYERQLAALSHKDIDNARIDLIRRQAHFKTVQADYDSGKRHSEK